MPQCVKIAHENVKGWKYKSQVEWFFGNKVLPFYFLIELKYYFKLKFEEGNI